MSKDDRLLSAYDNLVKISQYENAYSQIVYQVNQSFQNGLTTSITDISMNSYLDSEQIEAFKVLTGILSCSAEEEKWVVFLSFNI